MTKLYFTFIFLFVIIVLKAQENCPDGYEERNVKCNGKFVVACVPINYSCKLCWTVSWPACPETPHLGGADLKNSYELALICAENAKKINSNYCGHGGVWDPQKPTIYLDDPKFCSETPDANRTLFNDLKNKIFPFLQRYSIEIANFNRFINGQPYIPGSNISEYRDMLRQAQDNKNMLDALLNNISNNNISDINNLYEKMLNDEPNLIHAESTYRNEVNAEKIREIEEQRKKNEESQKARKKQQEEAQLKYQQQQEQAARNYALAQTKVQAAWSNVNAYAQRNQLVLDAVNNGMQNLVNIYLAAQEKKQAKEDALEARREAERLQAAQKQAEEEEQRAKREMERLEYEHEQSITSERISLVQSLSPNKFPTSLTPIEGVSAYFYIISWDTITHNRYSMCVSSPFSVQKLSDSTWPLYSSVVPKIKKQLTGRNSKIVGYFTDKSICENNLNYTISLLQSDGAEIKHVYLKEGTIKNNDLDFNDNNNKKVENNNKDENFWNK